ncbi:hypothetical protein [Streptomyces sp. NPDC007100]|uniref:hypothetical protein n=1 Tax=Streptomyces sp. NPDC007100 TaxID=3155602 RepID=UPI0033F0BD20
MRRRTLLATAAAGLAAALPAVDDALAVPPRPNADAELLDQVLTRARASASTVLASHRRVPQSVGFRHAALVGGD